MNLHANMQYFLFNAYLSILKSGVSFLLEYISMDSLNKLFVLMALEI